MFKPRCFASLVMASALLVAPAALADENPNFVGVGAGVGFFKGAAGPWLELVGGRSFPLTEAFAIRAELAAAFGSYGDESFYQVPPDYHSVDYSTDVQAFTALARALADLSVSHRWSLQAGLLAGVAHTTLESTGCSDAQMTAGYWGLSAGAALRLGEARNYEVGVRAEHLAFPLLRCPNTLVVTERRELSFDDPTVTLTARFAYRF